ncbi:MAG: ATP-binding protein [Chlorobaculum sp.]|jgi:serine/threonine-protein kinase RsbW|nr:ATP-binding protein [Chlorobaculum sp.]
MSSIITLTLPGEIMFVRFASQTAASLARLLTDENPPASDGAQFVHDFELAVSEAFTNSVKYTGEHDALQMLTLTFEFQPRQLTVSVRDANPPFSIDRPAPDIEKGQIGGWGLMLISKVMDSVTYRRDGGSNILSMSKAI